MRFSMKTWLLAGACLCAGIAAEAKEISYNGWISGALWGGGYVQNVVLCPSDPDRCYAYIDMAGVYRSDDKGKTWRMLHGAFPDGIGFHIRGLSVDPRNADHILIVVSRWQFGKGYLLSSADGGKTFQIVERISTDNGIRKATGFIIDRNPENPDEIVVGCYDGVMKSADNGKTWKTVWKHSVNPTDLRYDRRNPKRLWLSSPALPRWDFRNGSWHKEFDAGFYRSDDGGQTWVKLSSDSPTEIVQSNSDPGELYGLFNYETVKRSTDNGQTWVEWSKGLNKKAVPYHDNYCNKNIYTALGAGNDFLIVASTLKDFYRLDRGSDTWKPVDIKSVDPRDYLGAHQIDKQAFKATGSITVDPANQDHWYATDFYNVMQSFDGGKNWACTSTGLSQVVMKGAFVLPGTHHFVVSLMDHSWYISKDGGKTFQPYSGFGHERMYYQIAPSDPMTIYTSGPRASVVTVSRDGGKTWKIPAMKGLPPRESYIRASVAVDPVNAETVYIGIAPVPGRRGDLAGEGVYVSRDAGENWAPLNNGFPKPANHKGKGFFENTNVCGYELAVSKNGTPVAMSIVYNLVYRYDKTAGSWKAVRRDPSRPWGLIDLQSDPYSGRLWLAASQSGLLYSDDDGRSWKTLETFPGSAGRLFFDREKAGRFTVASNDGLYLTEDGGTTWWFYDFDRKQPGRGLNSVAAVAGDTLLLCTQESGVFYHRFKRNADGSPKGFVRRKREKQLFRTSQFRSLFGWGSLLVKPGDVKFDAKNGEHTALFSIPDSAVLRVECADAEHYATISMPSLPVKDGRKYRLSFQARGTVKLIGYFTDPKRRDFMAMQLKPEWRTVSMDVVLRPGTFISFLNWKQKGWFELRDFKLAEQ